MRTSWLAEKARFKPAGDEFPQIIQAHDQQTIRAIEAFYDALMPLHGAPKTWAFGADFEPLTFRIDENALIVRGPRSEVSVQDDTQAIRIQNVAFADAPTVTLFQTLHRVLAKLASDFEVRGLLGAQYRSRAYRTVTRLEFSAGSIVVQLDSLGNGPASEERLYVLDAVRDSESFLWSDRPNSAEGR